MDSFLTLWPVAVVNDYVSQFLYKQENPKLKSWIEKVESTTGIKREKVFYVIAVSVILYLVLGSLAQFLCNICGFAYPAYQSVKAIRTKGTEDDRKWLIYWTVFASLSIVDFFAESILRMFPAYWLLKSAFLVYLYLPQTNGAALLFDSYVDPTITQVDNFMANYWYAKSE